MSTLDFGHNRGRKPRYELNDADSSMLDDLANADSDEFPMSESAVDFVEELLREQDELGGLTEAQLDRMREIHSETFD